jgi:hypothetical protein
VSARVSSHQLSVSLRWRVRLARFFFNETAPLCNVS